MTNTWNYGIPTIQPGDPVTDDSVNTPIGVLANRTQVLKTLLDSIQAGQNIVYRNVPLEPSVVSGEVVYLNTDTYLYTKAVALYGDLVNSEGVLKPARSAYFSGVVIAQNGSLGDVLMSGVHQLQPSEVLALFGTASPEDGEIYYLSSTDEGQVTPDKPTLSVDCVEHLGSGIIRVFQPAFNNLTHTHKEYQLYTAGWITTTAFPSEIVPAGAVRGYDFTMQTSIDDNLAEILLPSIGGGTFTWAHNDPAQTLDGRRVEAGHILLDENGLWWMDAVVPTSDIWFNNTAAVVGDIPVLHTIINQSPDQLDISIVDGTVYIGHIDFTSDTDNAGYEVVKDIVGGVMFKGKVVEKVQVGTGLRLTGGDAGQGIITVELAQYHNYMVPSQILNLNQAVTEVGGIIPVTKFPSDRNSKINCAVQLPEFPDDSLYEAYIYMLVYGTGSLFSGITIDSRIIASPTELVGVTPATPTGFPGVMDDIPASTDIFKLEAAAAIDMAGYSQGSIYYEIGIDTPGADIRMLQTGVRLALKP